MNLKKLLLRGRNLLVNPGEEYRIIALEDPDIRSINKSYVLPVAILIALFTLIGSAFSNISEPINTFLYVLINAVIVLLLVFSHVYLSGKLIALLGEHITRDHHHRSYYALSSYAQLSFLLVLALIKMFPSLIFIVFVGLHSTYLFYTGIGVLSKIPSQKHLQFTLLSTMIMITSFIICSELYTLLYVEIIEQFTTFAAL